MPDVLPNILAVYKHLQAAGWKVSKSSLYVHHHEGRIRPNKKGEYPLPAVEKYASAYLHKLGEDSAEPSPASPVSPSGQVPAYRADAETRKITAQAEHWELRVKTLSGELVPRGIFERELAARAVVINSDFENFIHARTVEIIALVGGDQAKAPDLVAFLLAEKNTLLGRYSAGHEFTVDAEAAEKFFEDMGPAARSIAAEPDDPEEDDE